MRSCVQCSMLNGVHVCTLLLRHARRHAVRETRWRRDLIILVWHRRGRLSMCLRCPRPTAELAILVGTQRAGRGAAGRVVYPAQRMQHPGTSQAFRSLLLRWLQVCASYRSLFARRAWIVAVALDLALSAAVAGATQRLRGRGRRDGIVGGRRRSLRLHVLGHARAEGGWRCSKRGEVRRGQLQPRRAKLSVALRRAKRR